MTKELMFEAIMFTRIIFGFLAFELIAMLSLGMSPNATKSANQIQQWQQILRVNIAATLVRLIVRN
jgi:hypothetical protein